MTRRTLVCVAITTVCCGIASVAPAQQPDRPIALFDGTSLAGWRGDARFWSVEVGAIVGRSTAAQPCTRNTYLVHDGQFADFELTFEYRIEGGNSGVQYRSHVIGSPNDHVVGGYQADIEAGANYTGILYEERGRGILAQRGERVRLDAGGGRAVTTFASRDDLQRNVTNGWNRYVVRAVGPRVTHAINGATTIDVVDMSPSASQRGCIALQMHAGPPMTVRFRDLRLTPVARSPEWIWTPPPARAGQRVALRRTFDLAADVTNARLLATADNGFVASVDGRRVLDGNEWERPHGPVELGPLAAGRHVIAVEARNDDGPAAFALRLTFDGAAASPPPIVTDERWRALDLQRQSGDAWRALDFDDAAWPAAHSFGPTNGPTAPWSDPFAERVATPADSLTVRDGYRVDLVRSSGVGEGSWIALGFDAAGHALVSIENGPLARITTNGAATRFERLDGTPRGSMGFCVVDGVLFAQGAGADGYGLYRLDDRDGDGRYETSRRLAALGGGGEHGAHAVVPGPDGALYLMNGNMSPLPPRLAPTSPHRNYAEDLLLPRLEDPRGHAVGVRAPGGHVLRVDRDGRTFELVAAGLRNAYDLAFAPDGEMFTFDSDMEWDIGLPWYRPTRIVHVVSGGEYGWRSGAGKWPADHPDSLPAVVDVGIGSPTGIVHGAATRFAARERRALFVADWAFGRILAVHLAPDGASFRGTFEHFVTGKPLNVTDLAIGPDGALWFTTGGRGTQSGLYRVTWNGGDEAASTAAASVPTNADPSAAVVARRSFEALHGAAPEPAELPRIVAALGSADRFVRHAARIALERVPVDAFADAVSALPPGRAAIHGLLVVARVGDDARRKQVLAALRRFDASAFAAADRATRHDWLRVHAVALARANALPDVLDDAARRALVDRFAALYPTDDTGLDRELLALLVALRDSDVVPRAVARLPGVATNEPLDAAARADGIAIAYALRVADVGFDADARRMLFAWLGRAKSGGGGQSLRGYVEAIERDLLARAPEADRDALRAAAAPPPARHVVVAPSDVVARSWTLAELAPHLAAVDRGRDFVRGAAAYRKAICIACHRFDGDGGDVGPDLTAASSRFSRRDLVRAILEPSADISDQYRVEVVTLRGDRTLVGRLVADDRDGFEWVVDPLTDRRERASRVDVVRREPSSTSSMPAGLFGLLSLDEILDLIAYVESGGNRDHPSFAK